MNELDWQARIVKRLNEQGGYGTKIDTSNLMGRPDLLLATPEARMFMVEVKYERLWNKNTMRTIGLSVRQSEELRLINKGGGTALVLVVVSILESGRARPDHYLALHKAETFYEPVYRNRVLEGNEILDDFRSMLWHSKCDLRGYLNRIMGDIT